MTQSLEQMLSGSIRLSSLPEIYTKINDVINDPECSFNDVAEVISNDTSLSVRLLKIVNSSFYNFPSKIGTIAHAVSIVGTQQLRDLALATTVISAFKGMPEEYVSMDTFWKHSVSCAVAAWVVAIHCREANAERYYLAGILHDIGRLVIFENHPEIAEELMNRHQAGTDNLYEVERAYLGYDHGEVGAALLAEWDLPEYLQEIVANHHQPLESKRFPVETAILNVADFISKSMELGHSGDRYVPAMDDRVWKKIGLTANSLASIWDQVEIKYQSTIEIFLSS